LENLSFLTEGNEGGSGTNGPEIRFLKSSLPLFPSVESLSPPARSRKAVILTEGNEGNEGEGIPAF
jgi:hypothetical protein